MALCLINNNNSSSKQDKLVSGTNIKTINNTSLLDSGNIITMQLVSSPVSGNILTTDVNGQAVDSGKKLSDLQSKLTAGSNITINDNTISATDTKYSAGSNIQISSSNVISATDTKYTAASNSPITVSGTTITNTNACKVFGNPSGVHNSILAWITNFPNYNTFEYVSSDNAYSDAPEGKTAGYIVVSRNTAGDKNIGVTWTSLGGQVYKRVYSRSIYYKNGSPMWTGNWELVGGTLNQIFKKVRYSVNSSATAPYPWEVNWPSDIINNGYRPVNYDLIYQNSSSVITAAEIFNNNKISGYCSRGSHNILIDVLFIKSEAVSISG